MSIPRHPGHFFRAACPFTPLRRTGTVREAPAHWRYRVFQQLPRRRQTATARSAPYSVACSGEFRGASHEAAPYNFMRDSMGLPIYRQAMGLYAARA